MRSKPQPDVEKICVNCSKPFTTWYSHRDQKVCTKSCTRKSKTFNSDGTKSCGRCGTLKSLSEFHKHKTNGDGRHSWCKLCTKEANRISQAKTYASIEKRASELVRTATNRVKKQTGARSLIEIVASDIVELWNRQNHKCYYTGLEMTLAPAASNSISLDRIDSLRGYVKDNVVLCCYQVNVMKQDLTIDELRYWSTAINKGLQ
jgi:hypothetical protein